MSANGNHAGLQEAREGLRSLPPPYLLRKYEATPEEYEEITDEDLRCEYFDGVLIVHSPATFDHEKRVIFLATLLNNFAASRGLGWVLGSNTVMQLNQRRFCPDLSFLSAAHANRVQNRRVMGPVDLAIEFLSTSTRQYDLGEKRAAYRAGQVPEIWLIDAEQKRFEADVLEGQTYASETLTAGRWASRALPGFSLDVAWLWAETPPNPLACLDS